MKGHLKLIFLMLLLAACKPVELEQVAFLHRNIVVHDLELTIRCQLQRDKMLILPKLERKYYWFDKGKISSTQGAYSGKVLHGLYTAYDRNSKQPLESGSLDKGLKNGRWLTWDLSGKLKQSVVYREGFLDGPFVRYDSLGKPMDTLKYRKGMLVIRSSKNDTIGIVYRIKGLFKKKK